MLLDNADIRKLRAWIGERIPEGGSEADTRFTDQELLELAEDHDYLTAVAADAWRLKAGWVLDEDGGVVEKKVGSEQLKFVDPQKRYQHYMEMADYYDSITPEDANSVAGSVAMELDPPDVLGTGDLAAYDLSRLICVDTVDG